MDRYCILDTNVINTLHSLKELKIDQAKINGCLIVIDSDRYDNFYAHGLKCACCGLEAAHAAIEKNKEAKHYHINFYGIRDGKEVLLTKDHIYPRALGGFDILENYQVLCQTCNTRKKDTTNMTIDEAVERGLTNYEYATIMQDIKKKKEEKMELEQKANEYGKLIRELYEVANEFKVGKVNKREFF